MVSCVPLAILGYPEWLIQLRGLSMLKKLKKQSFLTLSEPSLILSYFFSIAVLRVQC